MSTGGVLFGGEGPAALTIANDSPSAATTLVIGSVVGHAGGGGGGIRVTGAGTTVIGGSFAPASSGNAVTGGLTMNGPGTLKLAGDGRNLTGGLTLTGGGVALDFVTSPFTKLGGGPFVSAGGTLTVQTPSSVAVTQDFAAAQFNAGDTEIAIRAFGSTVSTVGLGAATRAVGATVNISAGTAIVTTTTANTNGLWGTGPAFAVLRGTSWLANSGSGTLTAVTGQANTFAPGTNTNVTGAAAPAPFTTNSLRFNAASTTLTLTGANVVQSGGILVTPNAITTTIDGGSLSSGVDELIVHAHGDVTINSALAAGSGLTKGGPGTLTLGGANGGLTGPINVNLGNLTVTSVAAVNAASAINFNEKRGIDSQVLTVQLGDGVSGTVTRPIRFGGYGAVVSTDGSENSTVTLGGIISSAPGTAPGLTFTGASTHTSGFNLTAANTFVGNVYLYAGTLGINSDAALGGTANALFLDVSSTTAGGLQFLNGGVNLRRAVVIDFPTRIVSNAGDVNTITGPVLGNAALFKAGAGTLVLSGNNAQAGLTIANGTVRVNADANLGAAGTQINVGGGGTLAVTGTFATSRRIAVGVLGIGPGGLSVIDVADGRTFTVTGQVTGGAPLVKDGGGTLALSAGNTQSGIRIRAGAVRVGADGNLGAPSTPIVIGGGTTLAVTGTFATTRPVSLGLAGAGPGPSAIDVAAGQTLTLSGLVSNTAGTTGGLLKTGAGTLALTAANTYSGGTTINGGTLSVPSDSRLGPGPLTIGPLGTLNYSATTATARSFALGGGALAAGGGATVTLNGGQVSGGVLAGPGTFATTPAVATMFADLSLRPNAAIAINNGQDRFVNVSNGGAITVAPDLAGPTLAGFNNQGTGAITVGGRSTVAASDFQSYGQVTLADGTTAAPTRLVNAGSAPLYFNGGSRTTIATPATAGQFAAGIDLNGKNAVVAGGLFVNNGFVVDTAPGSPGRVVADFGALVKGAGFFQNSVVTQNGGQFQAGNSPGKATFGSFTFGPGGLDRYVFAINDATGTAGPSQDATGQVRGWGMVRSVARQVGSAATPGDFLFTADASHKLTVALQTLVSTTPGTDMAGPMSDFDPAREYTWPAVRWDGVYAGPGDAAALAAATTFDASGFANPVGGTFGWHLDAAGQTLSLTYTPVPEPGTLALAGLAGSSLAWRRRRSGAAMT